MDTSEEKSNTLSRCGSFYYQTLVDASKDDAEFVSHVTWQTKGFDQLRLITEAVEGDCLHKGHYMLVQFTDADIDWQGFKNALQVRSDVPGTYPPVPDYNNRYDVFRLGTGALLETNAQDVLADTEKEALIAPSEDAITVPGTIAPTWILKVSPELLITSITGEDGELLLMGQDYSAQYGQITFYENPVQLFPFMQFMAQSYVERVPSIYCNMLRLPALYTLPDRVLHYYRVAQTPTTLYLASAQAGGMAVVRNDCTIISVSPFMGGVAYDTTDGRYEAPYKHNILPAGTSLPAGYVIGGQDLFILCGPSDSLPKSVTAIDLSYALPVPGLLAENKVVTIYSNGKYRPGYTEKDPNMLALEKYYNYIDALSLYPASANSTQNAITHFRETACANKCITACFNKSYISSEMEMRIMEFLHRELPIGSVLTVADMPAIIQTENDYLDV